MTSSICVIPVALYFLLPLFSLVLLRRHTRLVSCFGLFLPAFLALLVAVLGVAHLHSPTKFAVAAAQAVSLAFLRLHTLASVLCLAFFSSDSIDPFRKAIYAAVLGLLLFSATLLALLSPFLPPKDLLFAQKIPPLLPPLLSILFVTLMIPFISYIVLSSSPAPVRSPPRLRTIRSLPSPVSSSPTSHRKAASLDIPPTFSQVHLVDLEAARSFKLKRSRQSLCRLLLASQLCALLSLAFDVCHLVVTDPFSDGPVLWRMDLVLQSLESLFFVVSTGCVMTTSLMYVSPSVNTSPTPSTPLTEIPARARRSRTLSSPTIPQSAQVHLPTTSPKPTHRPTLRILTTNLQNRTSGIRKPKSSDTVYSIDEIDDPLGTLSTDPFAPPELGAVMRESVVDPTYQPPQTRMSAWGTLTLPVPKQSPTRSRNIVPQSDMDSEYEHIHREEALLAQRLLKRLENGVGWVTAGSFGKKNRGPSL